MLAWPWLVRYEVSLSKNVNKSTLELFSGTFEFRYPGAMTFIEKKVYFSGLTLQYDGVTFTMTHVTVIIRHEKQIDIQKTINGFRPSVSLHIIGD